MSACKKIGTRIAMLHRLIHFVPLMYVNKLYFAFIQPYIDYGLSIWGYTSRNNFSKLTAPSE